MKYKGRITLAQSQHNKMHKIINTRSNLHSIEITLSEVSLPVHSSNTGKYYNFVIR